MVERMGELDAAARHPWVVATAHSSASAAATVSPGLLMPAFAGKHKAGENQRLRACPAFREPALDQ